MDFLTDKTVIFFIANSLYVISYTLTSMLWLRVLAIIAAISTMPYFYFQIEPLWSALFWQSCFMLVNVVNLAILLNSMRTPKFDHFESLAHELKFSELKAHQAAQIMNVSNRLNLHSGTALLRNGQENHNLYLLVEGSLRVLKDGVEVASLEAGEFAGELSFVSGETISADVIAEGDCKIMYWECENLEPLFKKQSLYQSYLHSLCAVDIAQKLRRMTTATAN